MGDIYITSNNTNPTSIYLNTTWEELPFDIYIKSGVNALKTGGSSSVTLAKDNLPNIKLKVDSFSVTTQAHTHTIAGNFGGVQTYWDDAWTTLMRSGGSTATSSAGGGNTGTASPSTETLGSGTAITIQPEYITLKFWKRLS